MNKNKKSDLIAVARVGLVMLGMAVLQLLVAFILLSTVVPDPTELQLFAMVTTPWFALCAFMWWDAFIRPRR